MTAATENCGNGKRNCAKDKWAERTRVIDMELTDAEAANLTKKAARCGLTLEEYLRTLLGFPR